MPYISEGDARDELFAGSQPKKQTQLQDTQDIVDEAVRVHKDTTATAKRALQVVEQTKQVQAETLNVLQDQGKQLERAGQDMDEMDSQISYADKLLKYMRRCCCLQFCDSCTGADPEVEHALEQQIGGTGAAYSAPSQQTAAQNRKGTAANVAGGSGVATNHRDIDVTLGKGNEKEQAILEDESKKQNQYLSAIDDGMATLLEGAKAMGAELHKQDAMLDGLQDKAGKVHTKVVTMTTTTQLGNMKIKEDKKDDDMGVDKWKAAQALLS